MILRIANCTGSLTKYAPVDAVWEEATLEDSDIIYQIIKLNRNLSVDIVDKNRTISSVWLDFDSCNINPEELVKQLPVQAFWYYTSSYLQKTKQGFCFRVVIPTNRPISIEYYPQLFAHAKEIHELLEVSGIDSPKTKLNLNGSLLYKYSLVSNSDLWGKNSNPVWDISDLIFNEVKSIKASSYQQVTVELLQEILLTSEAVMLSQDYENWIAVGQCLFHHFGENNQAAYELWVSWSKNGNYLNESDRTYKSKWASFDTHTDNTRKLGTLRHILRESGLTKFDDILSKSDIEFDWELPEIKEFNSPAVESYSKKQVPKGLPDGILDYLDDNDLIKKTYDWLMKASVTGSPTACLASAISFVGYIKSHGFHLQSKEYTPTNLYIILAGGTGTGKSSTVRLLQEIASKMSKDVYSSILTGVTGGPALQDRLLQYPRTLLFLDEIGRKGSGNTAVTTVKKEDQEVETMMIELFGAEARPYPCRKFAVDRKSNTVPEDEFIQYPHLSMIATTTLARFQNQNLHLKAEDGYLNRHLLFIMEDADTSDDSLMRKIENSWKSMESVAPPASLISELEDLFRAGIYIRYNVDEYGYPVSRRPHNSSISLDSTEIKVNKEIQDYLNIEHLRMIKLMNMQNDEALQNLYARYPMMVRRLLAIVSPTRTTLQLRHAKLAHELVAHSILCMVNILSSQSMITNSSILWDRIKSLLAASPNFTATCRDIYRRLKMKRQDIEPILQSMQTAGVIRRIVKPGANVHMQITDTYMLIPEVKE